MNTEITDIRNRLGWVCFDAECSLCVNLARRFGPLLRSYQFEVLPLQTPWLNKRLAASALEFLSEMRLVTAQGRIYGGADALVEIARRIWWARPVYWLSRVPLLKWCMQAGYRWAARNRTCRGARCLAGARAKQAGAGAFAWASALMPAALAVSFGGTLPAWIWMWVIALALFIGAKWLTILKFLRSGQTAARKRLLAFALFWPGMDARTFCEKAFIPPPPLRNWCSPAAKTVLGATLVWVGVPLTGTTHPLLTAWTGMLGIVLLLHFGLFHLLALVWRTLGIDARPIMQSAAKSTSLSRFWGTSWNVAFTDLMHEHVFKGVAKHSGAPTALVTVFLISGGLHELMISLPAHGGYGLPTAYFMFQAFGSLFERSRFGRALGLGSGRKGWCFVALVAGLPAFWLFHPPFVHNVILPMLSAIGAM